MGQLPDSDSDSARVTMIERIRELGVSDDCVLQAMRRIPREDFVPHSERELAYADSALPLSCGQTISQPYIVALMAEQLNLQPTDRVLDIGTGSGYAAAVMACLANHVYSVERIASLADSAAQRLQRLGYGNISVRHADGYTGWDQHAPFDAICVAAAAEQVPEPLVQQLAVGGRMVIPVGYAEGAQKLTLIEKGADERLRQSVILPVRFVPLVSST